MRFDDRLKTVLAQPALTAHDRAVRWRQLVELIARGGASSALGEQALALVRSEAAGVDEQLRAATARAIARPNLPAELVAVFAADTILVAAPILAAVSLSPQEWEQVFAGASSESRRFIRALHPEIDEQKESAAPPEPAPPPAPEPEPIVAPEPETDAEPPTAPGTLRPERGRPEAQPASPPEPPPLELPSISELLARIERLRGERERQEQAPAPALPPPAPAPRPSGAGPSLFKWECGPSGEIAWVEGAPRGALIGRSISQAADEEIADERIRRAFALRAPFRDAPVSFASEGSLAGEWQVSGVPAFEPSDGRFAGYRGIARRSGAATESALGGMADLDHDALRELVHEIKTPLNAIIGFAEIIDGQYLGPADFAYRERAAEIVAQARLLLAAIEDLDLAAQLRSSADRASGNSDLREVLGGLEPEIRKLASRRGVALDFDFTPVLPASAVERGLAERLIRRFCSALIGVAARGERLTLSLACDSSRCMLSLDRPAALEPGEDDGLPSADEDQGQPGSLAASVSLRLVRAIARLAGGDLKLEPERVGLVLPLAKL